MGLTKPRASQIFDIDYKQATRVITISNVTLTGGAPAVVDGVSLVADDRVLVTGQSSGSQNGIYRVSVVGVGSDGTWVRTSDGNEDGEIQAGMIIMVTEGTTYADTQWKLTTDNPIEIGTTALTFEQSSAYSFGTVAVSGQASVVADSVGDTLTIAAGDNISITTDAGTDTLTIGVTGISLNSIANGTSNVDIASSGGNVTIGIASSEIGKFSSSGLDVTGRMSATGNVTGAYIIGNGSQLTGLPAGYANSDVATYLSSGTVSTNILTTAAGTFGSVIVDTITIDAAAIATSGDLTLDSAGDITLNADGADIILADDTVDFGRFKRDGGDFVIKAETADKDIIFKGVKAGSPDTVITALSLDMSNDGRATFNENIVAGGTITGVTTLTSSGVISTSNTTGSTNTTSGALTVAGGIGVAENAYIGGNVIVTGNVTGSYIIGDGSQLTNLPAAVGGTIAVGTRSGTVDVAITSGYMTVLARSGNIEVPVTA